MRLKRNEEGQWTYYQQLLKHRRKDSARQRLWTSLVFYIVPETITIQLYKSTVNFKNKNKLKRRNLLVCTVPDRNEREKACSVARREWEAKRRGESWCYHFLAPSPPQREREVWASRTPDPTLVFILVQSNYESNTQFTSTWCQITT